MTRVIKLYLRWFSYRQQTYTEQQHGGELIHHQKEQEESKEKLICNTKIIIMLNIMYL